MTTLKDIKNGKGKFNPESEQTVADAMAKTDARKEVIANTKVKRPSILGTGSGVGLNQCVKFDAVPDGFRCALQLKIIITTYYDILGEGDYRPVKIAEIEERIMASDYAYKFETQGVHKVLMHYKPMIEGSTSWQYRQGNIIIGSFS